MAIISRIGRRHYKVKALYFGMYTFLIIGSLSMIYPFLLMLSGSTKGAVDIKYFDAIPRFLHDGSWLYRKHLESLFNESIRNHNIAYQDDVSSFDQVAVPDHQKSLRADQWEMFLREVELPPYVFTVGHMQASISRTIPWHLRGFKQYLREQYGRSIYKVNTALDTEFVSWNNLVVQSRLPLSRRDKPPNTALMRALYAYQHTVPLGMRVYASVEGYYREAFLKPQYGASIEVYNAAHQTSYGSFRDIPLARLFPAESSEQTKADWERFVRNTLNLVWIEASTDAQQSYQRFLKAKHETIAVLNERYGTAYESFDQIMVFNDPTSFGLPASDWEAFVAGWRHPNSGKIYQLPLEHIEIVSLESLFRDWLVARGEQNIPRISLPQENIHAKWFWENQRELKWEFVTRNYKAVAEYLLLHGRGIINTVVYCSLAILLALTINPLAAYAMSRYRMPSSYKILLFLMCTMAFPPMVTQIPNFLMLRHLGLLNTFAALVLPGMANGYAIFLLKGFFDAQPRELYESAQLDGASEWTIFWQITMSLSKPILAVVALQAFTMAYSNFMFAFVVCQDERMWTLMVWLYQLQQRSGQAVMYASLIIAAIPTFLIFLFCQNIIMRGIVVPSEK